MAVTLNANSSTGFIATSDTSAILQLQTAGTTALTVDTSANVGIGTASPAQKLNVSGSGSVYGLITNTGTGPSNLFLGAGNGQTQVISRDATTGAVPTVFLQGTTESMRILSTGNILSLSGGSITATGTGIAFPATQSASSDANTLDDYEEGTWTPSVGGTATYFSQTGKYTKIGNMVSIFCLMRINAIGTGSTTTISGLPFTAGQRGGGGMTYWAGLSQAVAFLYPIADGTGITFLGATAASANATDGIAIFQGGAYVIFSSTYFV
jgi:hypothetical protein